jgi:hypothetical protein
MRIPKAPIQMKKIIIVFAVLIAMLFGTCMGLWLWIDRDVKKNIAIAQKLHPGTPEDALIAFLQDSTISPNNQTQVAVWTLGQIRSQKALPVLKALYKDDPEGKTCHGRHNVVICQYGLHKAIMAIESDWFLLHQRLR